MSIDWDNVRVLNNPRLKEIVISFNGAGGFGAFGSNNNTSDTDPGGLPTDPGNLKPILPTPEEEQDGTVAGNVEQEIIAPEFPLEQCLDHDCTAYIDYYVNGGDGRLAHGINPTYAGGNATHNGAINGEGVNIDNPGGFPSGIFDHRFQQARVGPLQAYDERCDTSVSTWRLYRNGMPWPSRYRNILESPGLGTPFAGPDSPIPEYSPDDLGVANVAYDHYDEVWLYIDFNTNNANGGFDFSASYNPPQIFSTKSNGSTSGFNTGSTPRIRLSALNGSPNVTIEDATAASWAIFDYITTPTRNISRGLPEISGWWRLQFRSSYSVGSLFENPENPGQILRNISTYKRLVVSKPGLAYFLSEVRLNMNTRDKIRGIWGGGSELFRTYFSFSGSPLVTTDGTPKCYAISDRLHSGAFSFSRSQTTYVPPDYCERLP